MTMRALVLVFALAGCAVTVPPVPAGHPASVQAPAGRLAGPPATLRPGAVVYDDLPKLATPPAHHHHTP